MTNIREAVLSTCNELINQSELLKSGHKNHDIIRKIAEHTYDRVNEIIKICSVEKYNLYFNGEVGVGKSTAISQLCSLIDEKKQTVGSNKLIDLVLLKTAKGRTTVCETVITQVENEPSRIIIEPMSKEEFTLQVEDYCRSISPGLVIEGLKVAEEIKRLIENMLGVPPELITNEEISRHLIAKFNLKQNDSDFVKQFISAVMQYINYENRTKTEFYYDNEDFKIWLKNTFADINDGKITESPIPTRINIFLNKNDIDMNLPSYIDKIIDTRGIDGGNRNDIQLAIKDPKSLSLMCDSISKLGGNKALNNILKQVLIQEKKDFFYRVFMVGLEQNEELIDANKANNDRELGKKVKTREATNKFAEERLQLDSRNIVFYNAFHGYEHTQKKIFSINIEENEKEITDFFDSLQASLQNMYLEYFGELNDLAKRLSHLKNNSITESALDKFQLCRDAAINAKEEVKSVFYDFISNLRDEIMSAHPSVLRGSVNRMGQYPNSSFDLYETAQKLGGEEFKDRCLEVKSKMLGIISGIFINCDEIEDIIKNSIISKIDSEYSNYYEKNRQSYLNKTKLELYNFETWEEPRGYWGDGEGNYRVRVSREIINEIQKRHLDKQLVDLQLVVQYYDEVIEFLNF